jgi:hypothetical protein
MPDKFNTTTTRSQGRTNVLSIEGSRAKDSSSTFDDAAKKADAEAKRAARQAWLNKEFGSGLGARAKMNADKTWESRFEADYAKSQGQRKAVTSMKDEPKPEASPKP